MIGLFVGISLALAQALQLERPYWVPVSCLAVIQGASLRAVWTKQVHRIAGTAVGLLLAWGLLLMPLDEWSFSLLLMLLAFITETLVVRHYGLAVIFITRWPSCSPRPPILAMVPLMRCCRRACSIPCSARSSVCWAGFVCIVPAFACIWGG